ncbi:MAG: UvrD-helicase domain-containing protein [Bacteroidales bacterium]|jgi:ATP-dependent exoDNAse (exonuclease V) beta subunit|nr:UvrD-helicase domain-containing protein [Bacteroidales bacterium]MDD3638808.1 UvrD-helicase domain-containing protein [Bacteroidales bacterium]MDY0358700.1 UvrD-helicase domain-containing protein [Bacteroidales bacterium]
MALKVYKASAGTGKTYRLTLTYLSFLMGGPLYHDPHAFFRILAVTFTNKATAEMKARILDTLESLAQGIPSSMGTDLCAETGLSFDRLVDRARLVHKELLHNYSRFSVSTLDSFFQRVLRSFVLETGLGTGYSVDTDTDLLLDRTAGRIIEKVPTDASLQEWIKELITEKVSRADRWDVNRILKQVGYQAGSESFRTLGEAFAEKISDRVFLREFMKEIRRITKEFETRMHALGREALRLMDMQGFSPVDFPNRASSFARYFEKISARKTIPDDYIPQKRVTEAAQGKESLWFNKNSPPGLESMQAVLMPVLHRILDLYKACFREYATAVSVLEQLPLMGLLADVITTMREIQEENNTLDIGDSTYLLSRLTGDGNTPFVYEKTGSGYESFLLDEFQDTSVLQWRNMYPLLLNGLAQGAHSLIVGDVKQSIYRWRNSDWRILGEQIANDPVLLNLGVEFFTLDTNRRSRPEIVSFVNLLIDNVLGSLKDEIRDKIQEYDNPQDRNYLEDLLQTAYSAHKEKVAEKPFEQTGGYVRVNTFFPDMHSDAAGKSLRALKDLLVELQERGFKPSDILILVRSKENARTVSHYFFKYRREHQTDGMYCPDVVSEDSLYLASSPYVSLAVSLLKLCHFPENSCVAETVVRLSREYGRAGVVNDRDFLNRLRFLPLADAFEAIVQKMEWTRCVRALPYLQDLHDTILQFASRDSGGVYAFLKWWDDRGKQKMLTSDPPLNAIRLLTIHKAKGLEAPVVIVPFCNWPLDSRSGSQIIWTGTDAAPFNRLKQVPVQYNDRLKHTLFSRDYYLEYAQRVLDSLNLLYVAVTRPRDELYLFLPFGKNASRGEISYHVRTALASGESPTDETWSYGRQLPVPASEPALSPGYRMEEYPSADFSNELKISYRDEAFDYSPDDSLRQWGIVLHKLLSRIEKKEDVAVALEDLVLEGALSGNNETIADYARAIEKTLSEPPVNQWFDGSWVVRNEASILGPGGKIRPDRVMEKEGKVVVLDYKFGNPDRSHNRQMETYVTALRRMGYPSVEGHVIYVKL